MNQPIIPEGSVIITPAEMYREVRDTHDEVKALSLKVDALVDSTVAQVKDHEGRLRSLERNRWVQAGGISVLAAGISAAISFLK